MATDQELFNKIGRCIRAAADNFENRATVHNSNALDDIEADLEVAVKAIKKLTEQK